MALTPTERSRRSRAHAKNDHSLCDPRTCGGTVSEVRSAAALSTSRGELLAEQLVAEPGMTPAEKALAVEVGRLLDRLDRLHAYLDDRTWLQFQVADYSTDTTTTVIVKVDRVLSEVRQQQETLRSVVGELRQHRAAKPAAPAAPGPQRKGAGLAELIDLASRR